MAGPATAEISFSRQMGLSHREFFRSLPKALGEQDFRIDGNTVTVDSGARKVQISLGEQGERVIALLRLPTIEVQFRFTGYAQADVDAFMERFDLYFRRGGG